MNVLVVPLEGMGNTNSAYVAKRAIGIWNPSYVFLTGIAGGARAGVDGLRLGDVLVPEQVVGYELAKVTASGTAPRYQVYRPDKRLLDAARDVPPDRWAGRVSIARPDDTISDPAVHFGSVLSGEKVVADRDYLDDLRGAWPKAIGVEMECLGVALAAYDSGPGFGMAKAVSDFGEESKNDAWQAYAAETAARFTVAVLGSMQAPPRGRHHQSRPVGAVTTFPGPAKLAVCRRLLDDWKEVADYFEVPPHGRARFGRGDEPRELWAWLEIRDKLHELPDALVEIGRGDLSRLLRDEAP